MLRWITPLGWIEEMRPLTSPRLWVLAPVAALVAVLGAGTILLAGRRDVGAGTLPDRSTLSSVRRLPTSPWGLAVYLSRGTLLAWGVPSSPTGCCSQYRQIGRQDDHGLLQFAK